MNNSSTSRISGFKGWAAQNWQVLAGAVLFVVLFAVAVILYQRTKGPGPLAAIDMEPFRPYISAYTSGVVSSHATVRVEFAQDVVGAEAVGSELSGGGLSFSPKLKGRLEWLNTRTVLFTPKDPMPRGKTYRAELRLDKIFDDVPKAAQRFPFSFTVMEQSYEMAEFYYFARVEGGQLIRDLRGVIYSADVVSEAAMAELVEVSCDGKPLKVQVTANAEGKVFNFVAEGGQLESGAHCRATIRGEGNGKGEEREFTLPNLEEFALVEHRVYDGDNQRVELQFTQPLEPTQPLEGLVSARVPHDRTYPSRVSVRGNILVVELTEPVVSSGVELTLLKHLKNYHGTQLRSDVRLRLNLSGPTPRVEFLNDGSILPVTGGNVVHIPFRAKGLRGVDLVVYKVYSSNIPQYFQSTNDYYFIDLNRVAELVLKKTIAIQENSALGDRSEGIYALDLSDLVKLEPGAIYRVGLSMRRELTVDYCDPGSTLHDAMDLSELRVSLYDGNYYEDGFSWRESWDPTTKSYYYDKGVAWKNILVTDIGLLAKATPAGRVKAWATSLTQGAPLQGVKVTLLDYQLQPLGQGSTDSEGAVEFSCPPRKEPFLLVATQGNMYSYLPIKENKALSFSTFDVEGKTGQGGLQGFFYGEREVWSPGDSIHLSFILQDRLNTLPADHPISFYFFGPRGELLERKVVPGTQYNMYRFSVATAEGAPTGLYRVEARVGENSFSMNPRVETVKPHRLQVLVTPQQTLYSGGDNLSVALQAQWLHGAPARGLSSRVSYRVQALTEPFPKQKDYRFMEANARQFEDEYVLADGTLDEAGKMRTEGRIPNFSSAPGLLSTRVKAVVREAGGGMSMGSARVTISPFSSYVGLKVPKENRYYLSCGKEYNIEGVVLQPDGSFKPDAKVRGEVYAIAWDWWWEHDYTDVAGYISSRSSRLVKSFENHEVKDGKFSFPLRVEEEASGRYLVRVVDEVSGHAASEIVYFGEYSDDGSGKHQTVLALSADRKEYKVGDKARIRIPSPRGGSILVSVESGAGVLSTHWLKAEEGVTEFTLPIESGHAPNVYLTVTLVQPYAQTANDLPLRLYGSIPLMVENPDSRLNLTIDAPAEIRPGKTVTVRVRETSGRPMAYTLAVVDEGLLSLTGYNTPDPWSFFNAKQALGVNTFDLFDNVIGAYAGHVTSVLSVGGDEMNPEKEVDWSERMQRFRPIAKLYGPFELNAKGVGTVNLNIENYIGRVRIMAVACNRTAYGSAKVSVPVRSPLMVQLSLPDGITPFDSLSVPVTVFSGMKNPASVNLSLRSEGTLSLTGKTTRTVQLGEGKDHTEWFKGFRGTTLGEGTLTVEASSGGERAEASGRIVVVNPQGRLYKTVSKTVDAGKSETLRNEAFLNGKDPEVFVEVSAMPLFDFERHYRRLTAFTSAYAPDVMAEGVARMVNAALYSPASGVVQPTSSEMAEVIKALQRCQTPTGGFAYWPQHATPSGYLSCCVGEFLLAAKRRGYYVPASALRSWVGYQQQRVKNWKPGTVDDPDWEQAYRLYTLTLAGENAVGAMNRLREVDSLSAVTRHFLAAAYRLKGNEQAVTQLLSKGSVASEGEGAGIMAIYTPEWLNAVSRAYLTLQAPLGVEGHEVMRTIAQKLREQNWLSPCEVSCYMMALCDYAEKLGSSASDIKGTLQIDGGKSIPLNLASGSCYRHRVAVKAGRVPEVKFTNGGGAKLFLSLINSGVPTQPVSTSYSQGLRLSLQGMMSDLSQEKNFRILRQGESFVLEVVVENTGGREGSMELELPLPAGWVLQNAELNGENVATRESFYEYRDVKKGRVTTYFQLGVGEQKRFHFQLHANYRGSFYFPSVQCRAVNSPDIRAAQGGMQVRVVQ